MSNGHYTALVSAYQVLHFALELIAKDAALDPPAIAKHALDNAHEIAQSVPDVQTQPKPEEATK